MRNFFVSAVLSCGLVAAVANADTLVFTGGVYDVYFTPPVVVGVVEDLLAFTVRIENTTGDAGYDPGAFDGMFFGYTGITGKLHQHYSPTFTPTTPTTDSAAYASAIDTHFLFTTAEMVVVLTSPAEDTEVSPSTEPTDAPSPFDGLAATSYGSYLTGAFATLGGPIVDLAYVVVEQGTWAKLDFFMSGATGGEHILCDIPEPSFAGLMLIGGIGLLRRRRRSRT